MVYLLSFLAMSYKEKKLRLPYTFRAPLEASRVQGMQCIRVKLLIPKPIYQIKAYRAYKAYKAYRAGYRTIPRILKLHELSNFSQPLNVSV